jgi:hypothetical protein
MFERKTRAQQWSEQQMLNPMSPATPPPESDPQISVSKLLKLLNDPKAAKQHLAEIASAHAAAAKAKATELARLQAEHEDNLAERSRDQTASLAAERKAFEADCQKREADLKLRERQMAESEAALKLKHEAADAMKADAKRRLERISLAATETV